MSRIARQHIPPGHFIVKSGIPLDDDLYWSWTTKEWIRADDPYWKFRFPAEDCVMVIRRARHAKPTEASVRNYTVPRSQPDKKEQKSLFG